MEENSKENKEKIKRYNEQLMGIINGLDSKLDHVVKKNQEEFYRGYHIWIKNKDEEFKKALDILSAKINEKDRNDEKI